MDEAKITFDITAWTDKLAQLSVATDRNMIEVLNEEWPLLMRRIVQFTPPKTLAQGRAAVSRDIGKTMRPFDPANIRTKSLRKIVEERDIEAFNVVAARSKSEYLKGNRAVAFDPSVHKSQRDNQGRIRGSYHNIRVLGSDAKLLKRYVKHEQDNVGIAKAGWLPALHLLGQQGPAYAERHDGVGAVLDNRQDPNNPSLTAINRTPWANRKDEGHRIVQDAIYSRAVAVFEKTKAMLRLASKQAGFDTK